MTRESCLSPRSSVPSALFTPSTPSTAQIAALVPWHLTLCHSIQTAPVNTRVWACPSSALCGSHLTRSSRKSPHHGPRGPAGAGPDPLTTAPPFTPPFHSGAPDLTAVPAPTKLLAACLRAVALAVPSAWNTLLPAFLRARSLTSSQSQLKGHFLREVTPDMCIPPTPSSNCSVTQSRLTLCDPVDCSPLGSSPWDFQARILGVGCHFLLQGIFPSQGLNPRLLCLLYWQVDSPPLHHMGSPHPVPQLPSKYLVIPHCVQGLF